jgi:hypothetical protein
MTGFKQDLKDTFSLRGVSAMQLIKRVIAEVQQDNCAVYAASLASISCLRCFRSFFF